MGGMAKTASKNENSPWRIPEIPENSELKQERKKGEFIG